MYLLHVTTIQRINCKMQNQTRVQFPAREQKCIRPCAEAYTGNNFFRLELAIMTTDRGRVTSETPQYNTICFPRSSVLH